MNDKVVKITLDPQGRPVPDQDPVVVSKKDNQKVRWTASFEFQIDVTGYDDLTYNSTGGDYRCTTGAFPEVRQYKYSISANGQVNDPDLDIRP